MTAQQGTLLWQCSIRFCCLLQGKQEQSSREPQRPSAMPHQTRARTAAVSGSAIGAGSRANSDNLINDGAGPLALQSLGSGLTGASLLGGSGQGGEGGSGSHLSWVLWRVGGCCFSACGCPVHSLVLGTTGPRTGALLVICSVSCSLLPLECCTGS